MSLNVKIKLMDKIIHSTKDLTGQYTYRHTVTMSGLENGYCTSYLPCTAIVYHTIYERDLLQYVPNLTLLSVV